MPNFINKIKKNKVLSGVVLVIIIIAGYYGYQKFFNVSAAETRYVLAKAEKGTLIVSVSGTGQVAAASQVDIKPKVAGDIISVNVKNGDEVKAGALLFQLDSKDAQKSIRDAEVNLTSAKLALDKLNQSADALSVLQAQNALTQAKDSLTKLKTSQEIDYQKALDSKKSVQDDLSKVISEKYPSEKHNR